MSDDNKPPEEPKTVFAPGAEPETEFQPGGGTAIGAAAGATTGLTGFAPRQGTTIQVGDVLNHIFEVKRFIARGGMGEVFEGVNVNTDERVAIKVMLPALAADENVISMFRKEARTLTRLRHDALVHYRVLAQEPQLGVLYIVTEFIDGLGLSTQLGKVQPSQGELLALLRRLAAGLDTAHKLGAIHRDIAPDNILLEDGALARAKIIDFGIAKEMDPGSATIVGDGFAGKLGYVAPEQLGDFGRAIGPWTDVYSLALVILALAQGRDVNMGGSLVDAVDKRRAGPDLGTVEEPLRGLLTGMLRPDPAERLQSMEAVLAELAAAEAPVAQANGGLGAAKRRWLIGGGVAAAAALAAAGVFLVPRASETVTKTDPVAGAPGGDPVQQARSAIDAALPSVGCTWLRIVEVTPGKPGLLVKLTGVAGNPSAAQNEVSQVLAQRHIQGASIDFSEVAQITQSGCAALDTYRQVRAPDLRQLSVPQRKFEMRMQPNDPAMSGYPGENAANVVLQIAIADPQNDFAVIGLEPSGVIDPEFSGPGTGVLGREGLKTLAKQTRMVTDRGNDNYQMQLDVNHPGWSGVLLITGKGPFDKTLIAPPLGGRGPEWTNRFVSEAAAKGWQTQMVWFKVVDDLRE
ncbi:serine/threonine-protein kinase [Sphingomonas sp. S2-65]|uniref:serine/threonine-protein kinase n=1 Tax=Sphingomonas sp. S2-65 TaxID=2903960 RepID=UPI001F440F11|nr:serine/threonine-protein kinase [Sphingomonas sp. S2-65]UYY57209.1 serine/threonine protein kinase [Sphingomonas sp. S2-65]